MSLPALAAAIMATSVLVSAPPAPVPDFRARDLDGHDVVLANELKSHKAVVVVFLSTVCPYARYYSDHLRKLSDGFERRGVAFIGVNSNQFETAAETEELRREWGYRFPVLMDEGAHIADLMGARRTPEVYLIDATGRIRYRGWVKSKWGSTDLEDAIDAVLTGRRVRKPETAAYGCSIDRPKPN